MCENRGDLNCSLVESEEVCRLHHKEKWVSRGLWPLQEPSQITALKRGWKTYGLLPWLLPWQHHPASMPILRDTQRCYLTPRAHSVFCS